MDDTGTREAIEALNLFATVDQRLRWLPLFEGGARVAIAISEPDAGSDIGSISMKAVRDGDDFVLDGQKKYIANAAEADYLWMVVRTDRAGPRHSGLTTLIVPRDTPGLEFAPIIDLAGRHSADKVYLAGARVPIANVIGEAGHGWFQASAGAARAMHARKVAAELDVTCDGLLDLAREGGLASAQRQEVAECGIRVAVARELVRHAGSQSAIEPGHHATSALLFANETLQRVAATSFTHGGLRGALIQEAGESPATRYLAASYATIARGTSELLRNDVAARLGLPGEDGRPN